MLEAYNKIISIINKVRRRITFFILLKGLLLWVGSFLILLIIEAGLDYFFAFPTKPRLIIFTTDIFILLFLLLNFILKPWFNRPGEDEVALNIQKIYPSLKDDLINAIQLFRDLPRQREIVSEDLIKALVENTAKKIDIVQPQKIIQFNYAKKSFYYLIISLVFCGLFLSISPEDSRRCLSRISWPFSYIKTEEFFIVHPQNTEVLFGSDVTVEVHTMKNIIPKLKHAYPKAQWQKIDMNRTEQNRYIYIFESLRQPLRYSVSYRDISTPVYEIKIHQIPKVGDISVVYNYPAYTGQPPKIDKDTSGDIQAILGTKVDITAVSNLPLNKAYLVTDDGKRLPVKINKSTELKSSLILTGEKQYWFNVEDEKGYVNTDAVKHNIFTISDEFPTVEVLFPKEDLTVSETGEVKIISRLTDDFGINQLDLVYKKSQEQSSSQITIKKFSPTPKDKIIDYIWLLRKMNLTGGDLVSYYLEVLDNDIVSGPKKSTSPTYYLEVFSYEKEHEAIEMLQEFFHEELLKLLEEQITTRGELENIEPDIPDVKIAELKKNQKNISQKTQDLNELLDKMTARMNNDPLTTYKVYSEYSNMNKNLNTLKQTKMEEANLNFEYLSTTKSPEEKNNYLNEEKKIQDEIIKELEKMSILSEDIKQYQKMQDLLNKGYELEDLYGDFNYLLEEYKNQPDTEKLKELKDALGKLSKLMNELKKNLTELANDLPEEFINQPDMKTIDFSKMETLKRQLEEALNTGNIDEALKHALDLAKELTSMMSMMRTAAAQAPGGGQFSYLSGEADQISREIEKLAQVEQELINETAEIDKKHLEELLKRQEKLLKELAEKQQKLIKKTQDLQPEIPKKLGFAPQLNAFSINNIRQTLPKMQKIYEELNSLSIHDSVKLLQECIEILLQTLDNLREYNKKIEEQIIKNQAEPNRTDVDKKQKQETIKNLNTQKQNIEIISKNVDEIKKTEEEILEALRAEEKDLEGIFTKEDLEKLKNIEKRQKENRLNTEKLQQKLDALSRKTSLIGPQIKDNLNEAGSSMQNAEGYLSDKKSGEALGMEQEALYNLSQAREDLQSAAQALAEMEQKMAKSMSSFLQPMGASGGRSGLDTRFVEIPAPEDYQVPQDFRKQIMEGLKEKFPKLYDKLIKEYYKRLTE